MGWTESAFYLAKLEPMLHDFISEEKKERPLFGNQSRPFQCQGEIFTAFLSCCLKLPALSGKMVSRFWAFVLITALFGVHQKIVFILAIQVGTQDTVVKYYNSIFYEWGTSEPGSGYQILKLSYGIFSAIFVNTLCHRGISSLGNLFQLGLCLFWTYCVFREVVINGVLVWYADLRSDQTVEEHISSYLFQDNAALFFPAFCLHVFGCILRPLLFYIRVLALRDSNETLH